MDQENKVVKIPFNDEELSKYFGNFDKYKIVLDYNNSICNFKSNRDLLVYISNCNIQNLFLTNYSLDDNLVSLMEEYIRFEFELNISILSELWLSVLTYDTIEKDSLVEPVKSFIIDFANSHTEYIKEINYFFYSLNKALSNLISPFDKDLENEIKNSEDNKLRICGANIASLRSSYNFYPYIANLDMDKMYMFDEFVRKDAPTVVYKFITEDTPYKMMYWYNKYYSNPEKVGKEMEEALNKINNKENANG